jgi:HlyD family secretion protein
VNQMTKPCFALGIFAMALSFALGCNKPEEVPTPEVTVQVSTPRTGTINPTIYADATLSPIAQAAIAPKVTAPVRKFLVQRGAHVKAGELIAVLENRELAAAQFDNQGAYTAAQATYDATTQATVPEEYTKAQLDLAQAKANLDLDKAIVTARTQLLAKGAIPGRDLDTAKAQLVQTQAIYDIALQHLEALKTISNKASMQTAKGQLESARGKLLGAEAELSYTEIRSPINGYVTDRPLFAGETAPAGIPVITVMDTSALVAKVHLPQAEAQQLAVGGEASVAVPGIATPVPAKITLISPALDAGSTTVEVWLRVENPDNTLKAGTPVQATIAGKSVHNALLIPKEAVQVIPGGGAEGSSYFVLVLADGTAHKRPITLGIQTAREVQVLSGITTQDTVLTKGAYGLDEGTKVKIGSANDESAAGIRAGGKAGGKD